MFGLDVIMEKSAKKVNTCFQIVFKLALGFRESILSGQSNRSMKKKQTVREARTIQKQLESNWSYYFGLKRVLELFLRNKNKNGKLLCPPSRYKQKN